MTDSLPAAPLAEPPGPETRGQRTDGARARQHLLHTALKLFAEKGFTKTSTREIALAANANIASISYYFGDKAGLYRAAFTEPMGCTSNAQALHEQTELSLRQWLQAFIGSFLEPMKQGELVQQCTRLHFREMLEPTGLFADEIESRIKPAHAALVAVLARQLGLSVADDALHRLAFSITGLPLQLFIARDCVQAIRPGLIDPPEAIDAWVGQMVRYAEAMVAIEAAQRQPTPPPTGRTKSKAP
ncbi:MAG: transcriptional regulator, TetR family [Polaromonas sp.]|nr:transcriptional regulator, TetR family [Polaromonas sp.]